MIYVSKIYLPKKEKLLEYIDGIYESGWLTNNGPLVQQLEKRLEEHLGVENLLTVSNGTAGLQLATMALQVEGEAITSPFSFVSSTSALLTEGMQPVFADIDSNTYNIDPSKIEQAITDNTSLIAPVHVFGNPCDIDAIDDIAARHNLKVMYDASHTFGGHYDGKSVLGYGDASVISFHATKLFHTIEGGAVIFKDDETYERAKTLRGYGIDGPDSIALAGINAKMNEFEAAMGLCNLDEVDQILEERKSSYDYYVEHLRGHVQFQEWHPKATQNYSYIPVVFDSFEKMDRARSALAEQKIFPRQYFAPSLDTVDFGLPPQVMPNSRDVASRIMVLPLHSNAEVAVCKTIIETLASK